MKTFHAIQCGKGLQPVWGGGVLWNGNPDLHKMSLAFMPHVMVIEARVLLFNRKCLLSTSVRPHE